MTLNVPRLRMFAGPNGSGKSTIRPLLRAELLGVYVNPDDILAVLKSSGSLQLTDFSVKCTGQEIQEFLQRSILIQQASLRDSLTSIRFSEGRLSFAYDMINPYFASVVADFIRRKLIASRLSFTFETVMSFTDKVELLKTSRSNGFRNYLYYVATEDPTINVSRVHSRVLLGGHDVPENKIVSRYYRSLDLLSQAIRLSDRAYIFDNSGSKSIWIAEITDGRSLELKSDHIPAWFKNAVLDKAQ